MKARLLLALLFAGVVRVSYAGCPERWSPTNINSHLSGGGTTTVTSSGASILAPAYGAATVTTGKFYFETRISSTDTGGNNFAGLGNTGSSVSDGSWVGGSTDTIGLGFHTDHFSLYSGGLQEWTLTITGMAGTDRIGHALDLTNNRYWLKDVTLASSWYGQDSSTAGDPASNSRGFDIGSFTSVTTFPVLPALNLYLNGDTGTGYFDPSVWLGAAPSGFGPICPCIPGSLAMMGVGAC